MTGECSRNNRGSNGPAGTLASVDGKLDGISAIGSATACESDTCDRTKADSDTCTVTTPGTPSVATDDRRREHRLTSIIDNLTRTRNLRDCNVGAEELPLNSGDTTADTEAPTQPQLKTRKRRVPDKMNGGSGEYHLHQHHNNNNNTTSNNNNVKNERLSPGTPDTSSRSRSVTPSSASYPGTPPAPEHAAAHQPPPPAPTLPLTGRNYSDFMRSLAAKYNNANPNDYFGASRNGFPSAAAAAAAAAAAVALDARFKPSPAGFPGLIPSVTKDESPSPSPKKPDFPAAGLLNPFAPGPMFPPLIDMSTTQTLLAMVRTAKEAEIQGLLKNAATTAAAAGLHSNKRPLAGDASSPLDLSAAGTPLKRPRVKTPSSGKNSDSESPRPQQSSHHLHSDTDITTWSVDDVCNFVSSIDICAEYAQKFREQRIDGSGLPLLTEEHLTSTINMKLGPALKLRSILARKMGSCAVCLHCVHCHSATASTGAPTTSTSTASHADGGRSSAPPGDSGGPS